MLRYFICQFFLFACVVPFWTMVCGIDVNRIVEKSFGRISGSFHFLPFFLFSQNNCLGVRISAVNNNMHVY
jgi:hypothetical protein